MLRLGFNPRPTIKLRDTKLNETREYKQLSRLISSINLRVYCLLKTLDIYRWNRSLSKVTAKMIRERKWSTEDSSIGGHVLRKTSAKYSLNMDQLIHKTSIAFFAGRICWTVISVVVDNTLRVLCPMSWGFLYVTVVWKETGFPPNGDF